MSNNYNSYAQFPTEDVKKRALDAKQRILDRRAERDNASIKNHIKYVAKPRWFGLLKGRVIDRAQAIIELDKEYEENWYYWNSHIAQGWMNNIEEIIELCDTDADSIILSTEHNKSLNWELKREK